ncbi:hypothetical protein MMC10_005759 [Thelotrema lepadinum]|nr:hypothetical protein [Thelotrema lepadinum]
MAIIKAGLGLGAIALVGKMLDRHDERKYNSSSSSSSRDNGNGNNYNHPEQPRDNSNNNGYNYNYSEPPLQNNNYSGYNYPEQTREMPRDRALGREEHGRVETQGQMQGEGYRGYGQQQHQSWCNGRCGGRCGGDYPGDRSGVGREGERGEEGLPAYEDLREGRARQDLGRGEKR